jgi:2',3'-cyclic-nucleotide 2'-phosphodiesterase (5'-nucleotidase family)
MKCARRLIFVILLVVSASAGVVVTAQAPVHIVIAHTNDIHGQLQPRNGIGGLAEIATVIRSLHPDLILDAGDMFTGTFINDEFKGLPMIQAMNKIGYASGTIGNHEFDYGLPVLRTRLRDANFPVLSANVRIPISEIKKYKVITVKGIRFGIIGITTEETITTTHPKNLEGVKILDDIESIGRVLPEVRNKSDFIIVTAHLNEEEEKRVANAFPEIRLIIGGHVHTALGPIWVGQTMIAKTGNVGRFVGRVDLQFDGKKLTDIKGQLVPVMNVVAAPDIAKIIGSYASKVTKKMNEVIGEATDDLPTSNNSESPLGNLIADVYREKGKTQIGLQNTGGIRTRIVKGPITWGAAFEVLPFQNTLVTLKLTGAQLKQTLNVGLIAVSGLRVHLDLKKPAGQRLVSVTMPDGAPIDDKALYSITTNDFVMAGGDGFSEVGKGIEIKDTGILLRDVLVDYIKAHVTVSPALDGRVTVN